MTRLQLPDRTLDLTEPAVMGILNVTPDSFSDGGRFAQLDSALHRAEQMLAEGARIIEVGGESTRPGAPPVPLQEELDRVVPVIEALRRRLDIAISVDTFKPSVMEAACAAGAHLINDIRALEEDGALAVVLRHRAAVCLMHMQGQPQSMQAAPHYEDVVSEVASYLRGRADACLAAGVPKEAIAIDPGIGFGKNLEHNLKLLAHGRRLGQLGFPLLIGVSRKSMFQHLLGLPVDRRLHASLAAACLSVWQGAAIIRAHDVRHTVEAVRVAAAIRQASSTDTEASPF
jgi:dihydropteroate synthase